MDDEIIKKCLDLIYEVQGDLVDVCKLDEPKKCEVRKLAALRKTRLIESLLETIQLGE
jgi:hypothetical protein